MKRKGLTIIVFIASVTLSLLGLFAEGLKVEISSPKNETEVIERPIVKGIVSDPGADVWVIVHPMEVSDYWVQPRVTVRKSGEWKVMIHIGRPGKDVGKHFEIMAVANPKEKLKEGLVLNYWPKADARSEIVEVIRK